MNSLTADSATEPLLFSWDSPRRQKLAIALFLTLSLIAHALCFYVFQIVYPPTVALLPPPARVNLITADSAEGRTLLRWIDSEDPALAFTTRRPPESTLPDVPKAEHVPSYSAVEPTLRSIPPLERDLRIPSSRPPGAVRFAREKAAPTMTVVKTSVSFSKELYALGASILPGPRFAASSDDTPEPIRFQVAVNELGEIRYCLPINSSGDRALDQQARSYVTRCRFAATTASAREPDSSLTWGIATVDWGNDIARPQPRPPATLTP
jgi:hypothetical protein